jgi:hypothetical protein
LEALEDKVSLLILELSQSLLTLLLIVLHCLAHIIRDVLRMKHVSTEVQYSLPVDLRIAFIVGSVEIVVVLNKVTDSIHEIAFLDLGTESLFAEVGKTNEDVHEYCGRNVFF